MVEFAVVMATILVFVIGLVGGLYLVDRFLKPTRDPLAVLRERYAKGEIDEREFSRRLAILELDPPETD